MDLYLLVDESGSMSPRKNSLIGGFNELIQKQRRISPEGCRVSLYTFNEEVREVYSRRPLTEVPELTGDDYHPDCMTALRDAMGHVLEKIKAHQSEDAAAGGEAAHQTVLLVVMTDGEENSSRTVSPRELEAALADFSGQVTYMGSNQNAVLNGRTMGAMAEASLDYHDDNMLEAIDSLGDAVGRMRSGGASTIRYTRQERQRSSGRSDSTWTQAWSGSVVEEDDDEAGGGLVMGSSLV